MRIAIVGAGAMGCLFGARLAARGHWTLLVDTWYEHVEAIRRHGLRVDDTLCPQVMYVPVEGTASGHDPVDLVILLVKAHDLREAISTNLSLVGERTLVVTLANGLGTADEVAAVVGHHRTAVGTTAVGAILRGLGHVQHTVAGDTYVGPADGCPPSRVVQFGAVLTAAGLPTIVTDHVEEYIWTKLLLNVGYNALGAISRARNGEVARSREGRALLTTLIMEAMLVARGLGVTLHQDDPVAHSLAIGCGPIALHPSSMLQDVLRRRRTEVDYINGAIARLARSIGLDAPANAMVTQLVHLVEASYTASTEPAEMALDTIGSTESGRS